MICNGRYVASNVTVSELSESSAREDGAHRAREYWTVIFAAAFNS